MVIGIDIRTFITKQLTGVGIYTWEILNQLFKLNKRHQYKLFYNQISGESLKPLENFKELVNVSLSYFRWPNKLFNFSTRYLKRPRLDKLIGGCDVFWFPNFNFWQVNQQAKVVMTVHDLSFIKLPWVYNWKRRCWHKFIEPAKKLSAATKIIAVSHHTKNDLKELFKIPDEKIEVIYSGVSQEVLVEDINLIKKKYQLPERFILFLGTLEPRKNVEGVIQAFNLIKHSDVELVIVGQSGWLYHKIYHLAKTSLQQEKIHFFGYLNPSERFIFYRLAEMLVWPSYYEGFGFPPLEAMSQGCPVITSANSSLPEVAGEAAMLVNPYNIKEIALAIEQLLNEQRLRELLINRGYQQSQKFSWQRTAQELLGVFESLGE